MNNNKPVEWTTAQIDSVTGKGIYGIDIIPKDTLHVAFLQSPHPHAKIRHIFTERALEIPGVYLVITGKDIPNKKMGTWIKDTPLLAQDKVRYVGEPVAIVVAESVRIAKLALKFIKIEYEILPPQLNQIDSMNSQDNFIHENLHEYKTEMQLKQCGNVCSHTSISIGNIENGFKIADYIFEHTFTTPTQHQAYIEPHAATAEFQKNGVVKIWTSTDNVQLVREEVNYVTGIPLYDIQIFPTKVGGGFGGKEVLLEPLLVFLAQKTGKCVHWSLSREEEFSISHPRQSSTITLKTGVTSDGKIIARQATIFFDTGAYANEGPGLAALSALLINGPYCIPNLLVNAYCIYTNNVSAGSFRDFCNPQGVFAGESQINIIAREQQIDPIEFRKINLIKQGDKLINGQTMPTTNIQLVLDEIAKYTKNTAINTRENNFGLGTAIMLRPCGPFPPQIEIMIDSSGELVISIEGKSINTSEKVTILEHILNLFDISEDKIKICVVDNNDTGNELQVGLYLDFLASELIYFYARLSSENPEDINLINGYFHNKKNNKKIKLQEVLIKLPTKNLIIRKILNNNNNLPESQSSGLQPSCFTQFSAAAQTAEVQVNSNTGKIKVIDVVIALQSPSNFSQSFVESKTEGGFAQGFGCTLYESYAYKNGVILNSNLNDYRIPTSIDIPFIRVIPMFEDIDSKYFGAKQIGEMSMALTAPSINNAVLEAIGKSPSSLPLYPEKILFLIKEV